MTTHPTIASFSRTTRLSDWVDPDAHPDSEEYEEGADEFWIMSHCNVSDANEALSAAAGASSFICSSRPPDWSFYHKVRFLSDPNNLDDFNVADLHQYAGDIATFTVRWDADTLTARTAWFDDRGDTLGWTETTPIPQMPADLCAILLPACRCSRAPDTATMAAIAATNDPSRMVGLAVSAWKSRQPHDRCFFALLHQFVDAPPRVLDIAVALTARNTAVPPVAGDVLWTVASGVAGSGPHAPGIARHMLADGNLTAAQVVDAVVHSGA